MVTSTICRRRNEHIIPGLLKTIQKRDFDKPAVDMSTAVNQYMQSMIVQRWALLVHENLPEMDLDYMEEIGGCEKVRHQMSNLFNKHISPLSRISCKEIALAAGGQCILDALIEAVCDPGDGVMIATPYWSGLDLSISIRNSAKVIPVNVPLQEFFAPSSMNYYKSALEQSKIPVKAVLVCNPHNPLGQCYPKDTLDALLRFCESNNLQYISDEVYALSTQSDSVDQAPSFISALSLRQRADFIHVVYSLSKDFGSNGLRMGCLVTWNEAVRMCTALSTHAQISSVTASVTRSLILTDEIISIVTGASRKMLKKSCMVVEDFCNMRELHFIRPYAGVFIFVRLCSATSVQAQRDFEIILQGHKVLLTSGTRYHFTQHGWYRICYALEESTLEEGLSRISSALIDYEKIVQTRVIPSDQGFQGNSSKRRLSYSEIGGKRRRKSETVAVLV